MDIKEKLGSQIKNIPDSPGVYLMKDASGKIIYVGKAAALKKRLSSYFSKQYLPRKQIALLENIWDIDFILTNNETEALLLESSLIKKNRPKYNISLKDDKNYPLVKITEKEEFPRVFIVRRRLKDNSVYFGPYTNAKLLRAALKTLRKVFPYCTCRGFPKQPCLNYDIGLCPAPCTGKISKREYRKNITNIYLFLEGRNEQLLDQMTKKMRVYTKQRNFEKAKELRDKIFALSSMIGGLTSYEIEIEELKNILHLRKKPDKIEAFDISSITGDNVVGSMVSFRDGRSDKNNYRRFRIKGRKFDDCSAMAEIIRRRYKRAISENLLKPDLIIIDGGRGQLSSAVSELEALKLNIPVISIAKKEEEIFIPKDAKSLKLSMESRALNLIRRIRDEAHRFAVSYHRLLRNKTISKQYV